MPSSPTRPNFDGSPTSADAGEGVWGTTIFS